MGTDYPRDPVLRRRVERLQYLGIALVLPGVLGLALQERMGGSAMQEMVPGRVHYGVIQRSVSPAEWWTLLAVECVGLVSMVVLFLVIGRMYYLCTRPAKS